MSSHPLSVALAVRPPTLAELWKMPGRVCAGTDTNQWYPDDKSAGIQAAKERCQACPVMAECLAYALYHREGYGVWGGTSARERMDIWRDKEHPIEMTPTRRPPGEADRVRSVRALAARGNSDSQIAVATGMNVRSITRLRAKHRIPSGTFSRKPAQLDAAS